MITDTINELNEKLRYINQEKTDIIRQIQNEYEKELFEDCAPDYKLIISVDKNPNWNPICIDAYNKNIIGIKNAYYSTENHPELAKNSVIRYIDSMDAEPEFVYFFDCLLAKLCSDL